MCYKSPLMQRPESKKQTNKNKKKKKTRIYDNLSPGSTFKADILKLNRRIGGLVE